MTSVTTLGINTQNGIQPVVLVDSSGSTLSIAVALDAGDLEIGAVEIKDGAADIRQTVLAASTAAAATDKAAVVALHPISTAMNAGAASATTLRAVLATDDPAVSALGGTTGAKVVTDANGTIQQYLRGLVTFFANALGAGTAAAANRVTLASDDPAVATLGATTGAAVITDANGTIQQYLRGLIKQWIAGTLVVGAGSNLIGRTAADASAATGGIPSTARLLSAAGSSGDATNVKASAGRVYSIQGVNVATSARYLKLYNSASAPTAGSGTPVKTLYLPASAAFVFDWPLGLTFATGIGFTLVTGSADNSSTSVTAADILALNIDYA